MAWNNVVKEDRNKFKQDVYLGPGFDDEFIENTLKNLKIDYTKYNNNTDLLIEPKIFKMIKLFLVSRKT